MKNHLGKLVLNCIELLITKINSIPDHQFGFWTAHSTTQQCHRLVDGISWTLGKREVYFAPFLGASHKVWHPGLLFKPCQFHLKNLYKFFRSYLSDRSFVVNDAFSEKCKILSSVRQGSLAEPLLYSIYTADTPTSNQTILVAFANNI